MLEKKAENPTAIKTAALGYMQTICPACFSDLRLQQSRTFLLRPRMMRRGGPGRAALEETLWNLKTNAAGRIKPTAEADNPPDSSSNNPSWSWDAEFESDVAECRM
jgi:hypothetical protein